TVVYIHPQGRYCTVRYRDGLTDTVQTVPSERVAHKGEEPEGYGMRAVPVTKWNRRNEGGRPNEWVRDRLKSLHVSQRMLSLSMGRSKGYIDYKLSGPLSKAEQEAIIQAAERIATERDNAQ
ncbi:MAG: hypothetical protein LUF68_04215, partial [Clostridiales bacterium]|nr:hypothetical protein [Clostridiales bacterium]